MLMNLKGERVRERVRLVVGLKIMLVWVPVFTFLFCHMFFLFVYFLQCPPGISSLLLVPVHASYNVMFLSMIYGLGLEYWLIGLSCVTNGLG